MFRTIEEINPRRADLKAAQPVKGPDDITFHSELEIVSSFVAIDGGNPDVAVYRGDISEGLVDSAVDKVARSSASRLEIHVRVTEVDRVRDMLEQRGFTVVGHGTTAFTPRHEFVRFARRLRQPHDPREAMLAPRPHVAEVDRIEAVNDKLKSVRGEANETAAMEFTSDSKRPDELVVMFGRGRFDITSVNEAIAVAEKNPAVMTVALIVNIDDYMKHQTVFKSMGFVFADTVSTGTEMNAFKIRRPVTHSQS